MKLLGDRKWVLELGILLFSFILFVLNDWIFISSLKSFFLGGAYYLVLYVHAQLNRFYILPFLLKKQNVYMYVVLTSLGLLTFVIILSQIAQIFLYKTCFLNNNPAKLSFQYQLGILLGSYICIAGPSLFVEHYHKKKKETDKEILSKKIKIDLLNKQLNPHFLFNTMNTIYGLSIDFPERIPDTIMKVSELLRYQVESSNRDWVPLRDEMAFIESYIAVEKERLGYRCSVELNISTDNVEEYSIAPMIVFTFIENAFKHGTGNISGNFIKIGIKVNDGILVLEISNSLSRTISNITSTKVGLENTKTRLQMIYPDKYSLRLNERGSQFNTYLQIAL
ncbi:MAG: histidine kinase [Bergeyella sp.]|nr:histidine kinase [Bergeyella sp.]